MILYHLFLEEYMKIISWNVAGFRACLKKGFEEFFYKENKGKTVIIFWKND